MSRFKALRRKRSRNKPERVGSLGCLGPQLRMLRLEALEPRRLLSVASDLANQLQSAQNDLNNALGPAGASGLPVIGSDLGGPTGLVASALNAIESDLGPYASELNNLGSSAGPALQSILYTALGPNHNGADILGCTNFSQPNSQAQLSDIHGVNSFSGASGTLEMRLHETLVQSGQPQYVNLAEVLPSLPITFAQNSDVQINSASIDIELAIQLQNGIPVLPPPPAHLNDNGANVPSVGVSVLTASQTSSQVMVTLAATSSGSATLAMGYLQGQATLTPTGNTLNAEVFVSSLASAQLAVPAMAGSAYLDMNVSVGMAGDTSPPAYPTATTEFKLNFPDLVNQSTVSVEFDQLTVHLNGFFSKYVEPVLNDIEQYLHPVVQIYDILTSPIPGISSLPGLGSFDILDALHPLIGDGLYNDIENIGSFANEVQTLVSEVAGLAEPEGNIVFGSYTLEGSAFDSLPNATTDLLNQAIQGSGQSLSGLPIGNLGQYLDSNSGSNTQNPNSLASIENNPVSWLQANEGNLASAITVANAITGGGPLQFPVMDDPATLLGMLFGQNVNLVTFNTGELSFPNLSLPIDFSIPIIGVFSINAGINVSLSGAFDVDVGYNTRGLTDYLNDPSHSTNDLEDGLWIQGPVGQCPAGANPALPAPGYSPGTSVAVNASVTSMIGAGISVIIASASIDLNVTLSATVGVTMNPSLVEADPATGQIYYRVPDPNTPGQWDSLGDKIGNDYNVMFGDIHTSVYLTATLKFLFWSDPWTIANLDPIIWQSSWITDPNPANAPPPSITAMTADSGPEAGGNEVTVYGTNLENVTLLTLEQYDPGYGPGGTNYLQASAFATNVTPTSFDVAMPKIPTPPANAGTHYDQDWQVFDSDLTYNYVPPVNVNDLQTYSQGWTDWGMAAQGLSQGGTLVVLSGNSISDEDQVDFGGQTAALAWPFPGHGYGDSLYAIAPAGTPGTTVPITITGPDVPSGGSYSAGTFTYLPEPTVTSVIPASGPYVPPAGSTLTILGQNFGTYVYNNSGAIVGGNPTASMVAFTGDTLGAANPSTGQPPTVMEPVLTDAWVGGTNWSVTCDIPPGGYQGPGQMGGVDVQVETTPTGDLPPLQSATDVEGNWSPVTTADAYGYYGTAVVTSVSPNTAPASPSSPTRWSPLKALIWEAPRAWSSAASRPRVSRTCMMSSRILPTG